MNLICWSWSVNITHCSLLELDFQTMLMSVQGCLCVHLWLEATEDLCPAEIEKHYIYIYQMGYLFDKTLL